MNRIFEFPRGSKFLIIHADDLGMAHSINAASFAAFNEHAITSASAMVTCPWFPEVIQYSINNPMLDIGVHLTLTSEWKSYRWRPLCHSPSYSGLVDSVGYFHRSVDLIQAEINTLEREIRAQIQVALDCGVKPSHLDGHMFAIFARPEFARRFIEISNEFQILPFLPDTVYGHSELVDASNKISVPRVSVLQADPDISPNDWLEHYIDMVKGLKPGLNQLIVHLGHDDSELKNITDYRPRYGAAWRQRDFDVVRAPEFKRAIADNGVILINWRDVRDIIDLRADLFAYPSA